VLAGGRPARANDRSKPKAPPDGERKGARISRSLDIDSRCWRSRSVQSDPRKCGGKIIAIEIDKRFRLTALAALAVLVWTGAARGLAPIITQGLEVDADRLRMVSVAGSDTVYLVGSVVVKQGSFKVTGDSGYVSQQSQVAVVEGDVTVTEGDAVIRGRKLTYEAAESLAVLTGGVTFKEGDMEVSGDSGSYDVADSTALIWDNVTMLQDRVVVRADTLEYSRAGRISVAWGRVRAEQPEEGTEVQGRRLEYDLNLGEATITGSPRMVYKGAEGEDDMVVLSPVMKILQNQEKLMALDGVSLTKGTMHVKADSMVFLPDQNTALFLGGEPVAWNETIKASGDSLEAYLVERRLDRLVSKHDAESEYKALPQDGSRGEASVIKGGTITLFFRDDRAQRVEVQGQAWNKYLPSAADSSRGVGPNVASGNTMTIYFGENDVERAVVKGGASGHYEFLPEGEVGVRKGDWDKVEYSADEIEFQITDQIVVLTSNAEVKYKTLTLNSERARFYAEEEMLVAAGKPTLYDGSRTIIGQTMDYDLEKNQGNIFEAKTSFDRGFYTGGRIRRMPDESLDVVEGAYTTCDLAKPHYHFEGKAMKVYLGDKVVARPIVMYIRDVPVFALPFYVFSIRKGRHSGILMPDLEFGLSQNRGRFVRNVGYYWAPSEYYDATAWMDYYQNAPQWIGYLEGRYNIRYLMSGQAKFSFSKDFGADQKRWSLEGDHKQTLGEGMDLKANVNLVSDPRFQYETGLGRSIQERVNGDLRSNFSFTKRWSAGTFTAVYERDQVLGEGLSSKVTETRPDLSFYLSRRTIGSTLGQGREGEKRLGWLLDTSYDVRSRFVSIRKTIPTAVPSGGSEIAVVDSVDTGTAGSYEISVNNARKYFGWLDFNPSLIFTQAWFDEDNAGERWANASTWRTSFSVGTTAYGTFYPNLGPLVGFRHVLAPRVSFNYQPGLDNATFVDNKGVVRSRFPSVTGVSVSTARSKSLSFSLSNRFEAKVKRGERILKLTDLAVLSLTGSYDFLYKEKGLPRGLSDISSSLGIRPPGVDLTVSVNGTWDPENWALRDLQVYNSFSTRGSGGAGGGKRAPDADELGEMEQGGAESGTASPNALVPQPWQVGVRFGLNWTRSSHQLTTSATGSAEFNVTEKWRLAYSTQVDLNARDLVYQEFSLHRDLHCWEAWFTRRYSGGNWESYFKIAAKLLPEVKYEKGARDKGNFLGGFWQ
jgi:lipopolysaccharide assembly outer membrane protein LptD (OstA)